MKNYIFLCAASINLMITIDKDWYKLSLAEFEELVREQMGIEPDVDGLLSCPPDVLTDFVKAVRSYNEQWLVDYNLLGAYRNKAREMEKVGNYDEAISLYEYFISESENDCRFVIQTYLEAFERLAIIYRKLKCPELEIDALCRALKT